MGQSRRDQQALLKSQTDLVTPNQISLGHNLVVNEAFDILAL